MASVSTDNLTISSSYIPDIEKKISRETWNEIAFLARTEIEKKIPTVTYGLTPDCPLWVTKSRIESLDQAHAFVEHFYTVFTLSQVSKAFFKHFEETKKGLIKSVQTIISNLQDEDSGTKCIRECVDQGCYLKMLRVYFSYKPEALWNHATDPTREEGYKRTILHNASRPNSNRISLDFVSFIIHMDKAHNLGLALHCDAVQKTPYSAIKEKYEAQPLKDFRKAQILLEKHTDLMEREREGRKESVI
jgi:hypothetical protein